MAVGEALDRIAQRAELARRGASQRGAAGQALEVAHAVERLAQAVPAAWVLGEHLDGIEARADRGRIHERGEQPASQ